MNTHVIEKPVFVFVSNYLNHHQIPFCNAMYEICGGSFAFVQTEPVEEERVRMGWAEQVQQPYLRLYYQEEEACKRLISDAELVMFGGCEDESYIQGRLAQGKAVIRCSERLYRTGQWKAVSPRGLKKKYHDHTRYRKSPVYLLCAGAYVPSDFSIVRAYPGKMYCWGYFTETKHYDVDRLLAGKGWREPDAAGADSGASDTAGAVGGASDTADTASGAGKVPYILWAARMIELKHPELALETARHLKSEGLSFHMDMIGGGAMEERMKVLRAEYGLEKEVGFPGFLAPEQVREYMERADIFLFTSDRQEGWGAVINEAMNSGCGLIAGHMAGAAPFLVHDGENGFIYRDGNRKELFALAERLVRDRELCARLGRNAYRTITEIWNAENAAKSLWELCGSLGLIRGGGRMKESRQKASDRKPSDCPTGDFHGSAACEKAGFAPAPCAPAAVIPERKMYALLKREKRQ
ncbi:MAG: glycosyltransferase [Butyrivibrio sp.]|nr:glycosyltransferase [Acetatifactor muris]MCM1559188.1 glycosyltransferase [Butyrivibrio sp.]